MQEEIQITDNDVPAEVIEAVVAGRKVVAIKLLREATGLGLANAKVIVDRLAMQHAATRPGSDFSPGPGRVLTLSALLMLVILAWRYLPQT